MRCEICKQKVEETFLDKPIGTYVKDKNGKKHMVCFECQKKFRAKEEILKNL